MEIIPTIIAPENKISCANKIIFMNAATNFNNTKPSVTNNISAAKLGFISFDKTEGFTPSGYILPTNSPLRTSRKTEVQFFIS